MRKALIILLLLLPATLAASTPDFFDRYVGQNGFTTIDISSELFSLVGLADSKSGEMFSGIDRIQVVVADNSTAEFRKAAMYLTRNDGLSMMTRINEEGREILLYIRKHPRSKHGNRLAEFFLLVLSEKESVVVRITGDFDINNISKFSSKLGIKELDKINIGKKR